MEALYELIGEESPESMKRLKLAALKARAGTPPINQPFLSEETRRHFEMLLSEDFCELREHFVAYVMHSQRDGGRAASAGAEAAV